MEKGDEFLELVAATLEVTGTSPDSYMEIARRAAPKSTTAWDAAAVFVRWWVDATSPEDNYTVRSMGLAGEIREPARSHTKSATKTPPTGEDGRGSLLWGGAVISETPRGR